MRVVASMVMKAPRGLDDMRDVVFSHRAYILLSGLTMLSFDLSMPTISEGLHLSHRFRSPPLPHANSSREPSLTLYFSYSPSLTTRLWKSRIAARSVLLSSPSPV
jgi:hypothetical protein